jgi:prohibitin 1
MRPIDINVQTGTKDLQTVTISLRVLQNPIWEFLPQIHQLLGREYDKKIFFSIGQEVLRTVVAQCTPQANVDDADQLLKFREDISKEIKQTLTQKAKEFNVAVEDVSFMHLGFSREYSQAIEQKAVQQQLAERQKCIVARDEELKTAQIIRSEAEADSAKLINNAVQKYGAAQIEIKRLEAAKIIAEMLARNPNISFVPDNSNNLLNLRI